MQSFVSSLVDWREPGTGNKAVPQKQGKEKDGLYAIDRPIEQ